MRSTMHGLYLSMKQMTLSGRVILGGALALVAAWWTQPRETREGGSWERCSSCEEGLHTIYRFKDSSFCRQCRDELDSSSDSD